MREKWLAAIPQQLLTADGTFSGQLTINNADFFKVKQRVYLSSSTQPKIQVEIKRVIYPYIIYVGLPGTNIDSFLDISLYLVADGAAIEGMEEKRPSVPEQEVERLTYAEEPVVARRSHLVDTYGNPYTIANPLPTKISDGTDTLAINPDGSINVVQAAGLSKRIAIGFLLTDWVANQMVCIRTGVPAIPGQIGPHDMPLGTFLVAQVWRFVGPGYLKEVGVTVIHDPMTGNVTIIKAALAPVFSGVVYIDAY